MMKKKPEMREQIAKVGFEKLQSKMIVGLSQLKSVQSIQKWEFSVQGIVGNFVGGDLLVIETASVGLRILCNPNYF